MTTGQIANLPQFNTLVIGVDKTISKVYTCDLLSIVMGRAPADCAWITVMGNMNSVAVATLAEIGCIVLAEGAAAEPGMLEKAQQHGIYVYQTDLPVFDAGLCIREICNA